MAKKKSKPKGISKAGKVIRVLIVFAIAGILLGIADLYQRVYFPNVILKEKNTDFLYIPTGAQYDDVLRILIREHFLKNLTSFEWVASALNLRDHIHPGKYLIRKGMSNKDLILLLRSGKQTPVRLTINSIRTRNDLAGRLAKDLEPDSTIFSEKLNNDEYLSQFGFNHENIMSMFIPNTYEMYWNTEADKLFWKMYKEYQKFWESENRKKAEEIGLSPLEVSVLASIVEQETHKTDEKSTVAGVYMNRLKKGYKLEADPTLVFALGDFTVKRVLNAYKSLESPYNTYKYTGLPPGPICMPSVSSIKAVLNYKRHEFFYFCAKEDFSGYHVFAKNYEQHLANARRYQKELNKRNIRI